MGPRRRSRLANLAFYDRDFFDAIGDGSQRSASIVVPWVVDVLGRPGSVVDVGCGTGSWLRAFADDGVEDYLGVDGDYVRRDRLRIPADRFRAADVSRPLDLGRRFELVICLEVAEHLPEDRADTLVDSLAGLGDAVLFSAAIPYQGGVNHVNEQWPEYWAAKFRARRYVSLDPFRSRLWADGRVETWFAQNLVLFVTEARVAGTPALDAQRVPTLQPLVHPRLYLSKAKTAARVVRISESSVLRWGKQVKGVLTSARRAGRGR